MARAQFKIRRYRSGDRDEILKLHHRTLVRAGTYGWHLGLDPDLGEVKDIYTKKGGEFLVGTFRNKLIATGGLKKISKKSARIVKMRVSPGLQGRGFGRRILRILERRARKLHYQRLELDTLAAKGFYERNGYKEYKRKKIFGRECIFLEKML